MYTRCPGCHTVHPLNAALLAGGGGTYRCGKCSKVNNALESLFDSWPDPGANPPKKGELPVLGLQLDLDAAADDRQAPHATDTRGRAGHLRRLALIVAAASLLLVIGFEVAEFQGRPLLARPVVEGALVRLGLREPPPVEPWRDLEQIHLVSRELRTHPNLPGQLQLTATVVNRANRSQPYPDIEVTLLGASGAVMLRRLFTPEDYLAADQVSNAAMAPGAYLPLAVDLDDPGAQAVGFELQFR